MANMSYCRFANTAEDINECIGALNSAEALSNEEAGSARKMFRIFLELCEENGIVNEFDISTVDDMLNDRSVDKSWE